MEPKEGDVRYDSAGKGWIWKNGNWQAYTNRSGQQITGEPTVPAGNTSAAADAFVAGAPMVGVPSPGELAAAAKQQAMDSAGLALDLAPDFARGQMQELRRYAPQQADLFYRLQNKYIPQELDQRVALEKQYMPELGDLYRSEAEKDRAAVVSQAKALAPDIAATRNAALAPGASDLQSNLINYAASQLAAGSTLTPEQERMAAQQSRAALEARGLNQGLGAASNEAVNRALSGMALQDKRVAQASAILGQEQQAAQGYNPFDIVLKSSTTPSTMANMNINTPLRGAQTYGNPISGFPYAQTSIGAGYGQSNAMYNNYLNAANMANNQWYQQQATKLGYINAMNTGALPQGTI